MGFRMALFNHKYSLEKTDRAHKLLHLTYDDAFGVSRDISMPVPPDVTEIKLHGTATTNPLVTTGIAVEDEKLGSLLVSISNARTVKCVTTGDQSIKRGDVVIVAEHMDIVGDTGLFNSLATKRKPTSGFELNAIKFSFTENGQLLTVMIDPYLNTYAISVHEENVDGQ